MQNLNIIINKIFKNNVRLKAEETLLLIASEQYKIIATSFYDTAVNNGILTTLIILPQNAKNSFFPKKVLSPLMKNSDVVFFFLNKPIPFSDSSLFPNMSSTRLFTFCDVSENQLIRMFKYDMNSVITKSRKIADIFSIGKNVTITTDAGTDIKISISRFKGEAVFGKALTPGQYTAVPHGFCSINAMRGSAKGKIIANGSFTNIGLIKKPVTMHISNGRVNRIFGGDEAVKIRSQLRSNSKPLRDIISLGVGTNPFADFKGHPFEDKCAIGTLHITLGNYNTSSSMFSRLHNFDIFLKNATLKVESMTLVHDGKLKV